MEEKNGPFGPDALGGGVECMVGWLEEEKTAMGGGSVLGCRMGGRFGSCRPAAISERSFIFLII